VGGSKVIAEEAVLRGGAAVEFGKALAAVLDTREGESLSQSSGLVWLMLITRDGV
jgi:hypothetical protein